MIRDMQDLKDLIDELDGRVSESREVNYTTLTKRDTSNNDRYRNSTSITIEDI